MISSRALRIAMLVISVIGLAVAAYLTYVHYEELKPLCTSSSCFKVQTSVYSKLDGVPVALMGLIGYVLILISLLIPQRESTIFTTLVLCVGGFGFSAYLTYRELFSIHAVCEWCASSAVLLTILAVLSVWRFLRGADPAAGSASGAVEPLPSGS